jgi:hypothetical protein
MTMASLNRRLKHLEAHYQVVRRVAGEHARNLESGIKRRVLEHLSSDELRLLLDVARARQQGSLKEEMLTAAQIAALKKYGAAFDEECRKAGFASATDFSSKMRRR